MEVLAYLIPISLFLGGVRKHNTSNLPSGQLILPDKLQLLPLFVLGFIKSMTLRSSLPPRSTGIRTNHANPTGDERAYALYHSAASSPVTAMLLAHPNIFPLLTLREGGPGDWVVPQIPPDVRTDTEAASYHSCIAMPEPLAPSIASLEDDGVYLLDNGLTQFVYTGPRVSPAVKTELFESDEQLGCVVSKTSDLGKAVRRVIWQCRLYSSVGEATVRPTSAAEIVVFGRRLADGEKDPMEESIMGLMVNDSMNGEKDYMQFLVDLHRRVREKIDG